MHTRMTSIGKRIPLKLSMAVVHSLGRESLPDPNGGFANAIEPRQLAFGEDKLHAGGLIADVAAYFLIFTFIAWVVSRRRPNIKLGAV